MIDKIYFLEEASELLEDRYSPGNLRVKIFRGEISGEKISKGKRSVWGITQEVLNALKGNGKSTLYSEQLIEWETAQRHGTHGRKPKPVSEKTIKDYINYLECYFNRLNLPASIEHISPDNFEKCMWTFKIDHEKRRDYYSTRQKIYNAVTSFYHHLIKRGLKSEKELVAMRRLRPQQTFHENRRVLTDKQVFQFFKANDSLRGRTDFDRELSQTLFMLCTTAGLRRGEAICLEIDWINLETGQMEILGKGNKWRTIFANPVLLSQIHEWLKYRPKSNHPNLLLQKDGNLITPSLIQSRITRLRQRAGLDINTHGLRATFATLGMQEGIMVNDMQELLGHAHLTTTEKYIRTNKMRAAKTVQRLTFGLEDVKTQKENANFSENVSKTTIKSSPKQVWKKRGQITKSL